MLNRITVKEITRVLHDARQRQTAHISRLQTIFTSMWIIAEPFTDPWNERAQYVAAAQL